MGTKRLPSGESSPFVAYALVIDHISRLVHAQSHGQVAVLGAASAEGWLSVADLLSGNPSRIGTDTIEVLHVYNIGDDVIDKLPVQVFMFETKPRRDQKFWVDQERGLVYRARWQSATYQLAEVKINTDIDPNLFALNLTSNTVSEITDMAIGRWWPKTMLPKGTSFLTNAETKTLTVFAAARTGDLTGLKELLLTEAVNSTDSRAATPLWIAAAYGKLGPVEYLISKGADINAKAKITGLTPLHIAALNGHREVVELLLRSGANAGALSAAGETALQLALRRNHKAVVDALRKAEAALPSKTD